MPTSLTPCRTGQLHYFDVNEEVRCNSLLKAAEQIDGRGTIELRTPQFVGSSHGGCNAPPLFGKRVWICALRTRTVVAKFGHCIQWYSNGGSGPT